MTPNELREKKFNRAFGFGYRMEDVDRYLELVAKSMEDMIAENAALNKKLEVLADKISEYRNDEESLRTALLGAQKLGDSVIRESKGKAAGIMRDANQKAEMMIDNAKRQLEREQKAFDNLQKEVETFKNNLFDMYKQHLAIVSGMPGEIKESNLLSSAQAPSLNAAEEQEPVQEPEQEAPPAPKQEQPAPQPQEEAAAAGHTGTWSFGQRIQHEIDAEEEVDIEEAFSLDALKKRVAMETESYDSKPNHSAMQFGKGADKDKYRG